MIIKLEKIIEANKNRLSHYIPVVQQAFPNQGGTVPRIAGNLLAVSVRLFTSHSS